MRPAAATLLAVAWAAACAPPPRPATRTLSLDGAWEVRGKGDTTWRRATVPGTIHTDLFAAGVIPDPLVGSREAELRWIEDETWTYRRSFDIDPRLLEADRVDLVFEGLDTWASVSLNGRGVLEADNMFRTWRVDVRPTLRPGTNTLEVRFDPPAARGAALAAAHPWPIPHQEPDEGGTRAFSRKAQYHFGWDWGPRYATSGIWRPVRLEAWSGARIADVRVASVVWSDADDGARARVAVTLVVADPGAGDDIRVGVRSPDGAFRPVLVDVPADAATVEAVVDVTVPDARPWWPRGMGEDPGRRHTLEVDATVGDRWAHRTVKVGLRTVELVTEPDSLGESFFFRVNGEPVFARGANVVPPDHFTPRADSADYARLVDDAVAANMNMLRVWGGGVYLPDVFYDLADAAGVMVWQDFMFANTLVPGDDGFAASVAAEAADQVARLRHHPAIVLWCGNNEVAEGWANWGWRDVYADDVAGRVDEAYRRIFHDVLPAAVARLDPGTPYVPSSPRIGWGHPESLVEGDSHYWGVWWGMEPFRVYAEKVPRFASEFGFQALPDPATVESFAGDGPPPATLDDPLMRAHQKHPTGYETIRAYLERDWPVPADDSLDAWSHVSQLAQAEGVGLALEAHRRTWPRTGGTLFWQLNDTWPVVSWSSMDHFGRWKALQHRAREIFAPVAVLADAWDDSVAVWIAADRPADAPGVLSVRVRDFLGTVLAERRADVAGPGRAFASTVAALLPAGADPEDVVVEAVLVPAGNRGPDPISTGAHPRDLAFLVPPRELHLPDPGVEVLAADAEGDGGWALRITTRRFAYGVHLDLEDVAARASDDYMHLLPGDTLVLHLHPEEPVDDLLRRLRIRTLRTAPRTTDPRR